MKRIMACRNCKFLTSEKICPNCGSTNLTSSWKGIIVVLDSESQIAKTAGINKPGKYAVFVG
ncbi:MAG: transcription elongation factor subunit Spt4 [Candidatus Aenigmatarchaeota archaeon]